MPPKPGRPERRPPKGQIARRRALAALLLFGSIGLALWLGVSAFGDSDTEEPPAATTVAAPKPTILRIVFPEGFTRKEMVKRVAEVRQIAKTKRKVTPKLSGEHVRDGVEGRDDSARASARTRRGPRASSSRRPTSSPRRRRARSWSRISSSSSTTNWAKVDLADAKKKNLTPYDVLIIASMVEKETIAPDERPKVAAVIYNRLKAGMPLGIDATIRYGLDVPGTEALRVSQLESDNPYNTRNRQGLPPTPIANPGLASMQAAAHPAKVELPLLRPQAGQGAPLLHGERVGVLRQGLRVRLRLRVIGGTTQLVGLLRDPKVDSLSPRMQNAAFAALALDYAYVPLGVAARAARAGGARPRRARLRRRERDDAAQAGGRRALRRGRGRRRVREHARDPRRPRARLEHRHGGARRPPAGERRRRGRRRRRGGVDRRARVARGDGRGLLAHGRVAAAHRRRRARRPRDAGQGRAARSSRARDRS